MGSEMCIRDRLIDIGILVGTDFNPEGVKGIGPKTALRLIKKYGSLEEALGNIKNAEFPVDPMKIKEFFLHPEVTDDYKLVWSNPDVEGIVDFLCGEKDFSEERVRKALQKAIRGMEKAKTRTTLDSWFS